MSSISLNNRSIQNVSLEAKKSLDNDGRLDKKELASLKQLIYSSNLSQDVKNGAIKFLEQTNKSSEGFLSKDISPKEASKLNELANSLGNNPLAKQLSDVLNQSLADRSSVDTNKTSNRKSSSLEPNKMSFGGDITSIKEAKTVNSWYTSQYSEYDKKYGQGAFFKDKAEMQRLTSTNGGSPKSDLVGRQAEWRAAYSNCGPTSLKMVLDAKGIQSTDLASIRSTMKEKKYGATDADNVVNALRKLSGGELNPKKISIKSDAISFVHTLKDQIQKGKMPIMLSAYINDGGSPSGGHFMVVTGVDKNNNIIVSDPYSSAKRTISFAKFEESFNYRKNNPKKDGDDNVIISS